MKQTFTFLTFIVTVFAVMNLTAQTCPISVTSNNSTRIIFDYASTADKDATYNAFNGGALQGVVTITGTIGGVIFVPDATDNNADVDPAEFSKGEILQAGTNTFFRTGNIAGLTASSLTGTVDLKFNNGTEISCNYTAGVLPVLYADFQAKNQGENVVLTWTTGSEINNEYFSIERSTDGKNFTAIGDVRGAGNSDEFVDYRYTDAQPAAGVNYYRLRQIDFDGTENLSNVKIVKTDTRAAADLSVYPTVSAGELTVDLTAATAADLDAQIITTAGTTVRTLNLTGGTKAKINTTDLQTGIYFLRVHTAQGVSVAKFMVK